MHSELSLDFRCPTSAAQTRDTQITLPTDLYQAIEQQASLHGRSFNSEIVALLAVSLNPEVSGDLMDEFGAWEGASDEDWLNMETVLTYILHLYGKTRNRLIIMTKRYILYSWHRQSNKHGFLLFNLWIYNPWRVKGKSNNTSQYCYINNLYLNRCKI